MIVVDCSVLIAATFRDESSALAEEILKKLQNNDLEAVVPSFIFLEAANVLVSNVRRKRIKKEAIPVYIKAFADLPLDIDKQMNMERCVKLALEHNLTAYDAAYLELATRRNTPLATLDKRLHKAARKEGVAYRT